MTKENQVETKKDAIKDDEYEFVLKGYRKITDEDFKRINSVYKALAKKVDEDDIKSFIIDPVKAQTKIDSKLEGISMFTITKLLKSIWLDMIDIDISNSFNGGQFIPQVFGIVLVKLLTIKDTIQKKSLDLSDMQPWLEYEKASIKKLNKLNNMWRNNQIFKAFPQTIKHTFLVYDNYGEVDDKDKDMFNVFELIRKMIYLSLVIMCASMGEFVYDMSARTSKGNGMEEDDA